MIASKLSKNSKLNDVNLYGENIEHREFTGIHDNLS